MTDRPMQSPDQRWPNVAIGFLVVAIVMVAIQAATVAILAGLAGVPVPTLTVWAFAWLWTEADPTVATGLPSGPVVHWLVAALLLAAVAVPAMIWWQRHNQRPGDLARSRGMATKQQIRKQAGAKQLQRRAAVLRPSLPPGAPANLVGYLLGYSLGEEVWMSVEDSMILIGPSRSGKGYNFIIPMLVNAMGAVVTTSTRADNLLKTIEHRKRAGGPVWVFDPGGVADGAGNTLRWSPLTGAEDIEVAMRRLAALIPGNGFDSVSNSSYWEATSKKILLALFHAAALDGRTMHDVWSWLSEPGLAKSQALEILKTHPEADSEVAGALGSVLNGSAEQRGNDWAAAYAEMAYLASPKVRAALVPDPGAEVFDTFDFLMDRGTIYMIGDAGAAAAFEPVIVALFEEISSVAQGIAGASPGSRLDPPVQFIMDEAANFKVPTLPKLISYSGGSGLTVIVVLQSMAQANAAWGADGARAMWGASSLKMILPGISDPNELKDLETVIGDVEIERKSYSTGNDGGTSHQYAREEKRVLKGNEIRTLGEGRGLVFFRRLKPAIVKLRPWVELAEAKTLAADDKQVSARLRAASPYAARLAAHAEKTKTKKASDGA